MHKSAAGNISRYLILNTVVKSFLDAFNLKYVEKNMGTISV